MRTRVRCPPKGAIGKSFFAFRFASANVLCRSASNAWRFEVRQHQGDVFAAILRVLDRPEESYVVYPIYASCMDLLPIRTCIMNLSHMSHVGKCCSPMHHSGIPNRGWKAIQK